MRRHLFLILPSGIALSAVVLATAIGAIRQLEACPLCMLQRTLFTVYTLIGGLGLLLLPIRRLWWERLVHSLMLCLAFIGSGVAGRHVWLLHLPPESVPPCGLSWQMMLSELPFHEFLQMVLSGSADCTKNDWTLLGLSMPSLAMLVCVLLVIIHIWRLQQLFYRPLSTQ